MDMDAWPSDDEGNDIFAGTTQPSWEDDIAIEVDDLAPATFTSTLDVSGDPLEEHAAITSAANEFTELNELRAGFWRGSIGHIPKAFCGKGVCTSCKCDL
ncbi:hypothetical protein B0H14DRAFT_3534249 [Mycena olivaceomarginata]|nr:hypothetical protein B0H14DRAFT_3534249 [Mycena olivaceomarginata]